MARCARRRSFGSGVRTDVPLVATNLGYLAHWDIMEDAKKSPTQTGLSRFQRLRVHFYECDRKENVLCGNEVRRGPDGCIAGPAVSDGVAFYRSTINVILTEWMGGRAGARYFRFAHRLHRAPYRRGGGVVSNTVN